VRASVDLPALARATRLSVKVLIGGGTATPRGPAWSAAPAAPARPRARARPRPGGRSQIEQRQSRPMHLGKAAPGCLALGDAPQHRHEARAPTVPLPPPAALQAAPGQWPSPSPGTNSPLDRLCPGSAPSDERVQINADGRVESTLETPWHGGTARRRSPRCRRCLRGHQGGSGATGVAAPAPPAAG
jgi:hypothetical protein